MARKMIVEGSDGSRETFEEVLADNEAQLQEFLKDNPDLFPMEELGLSGPLMVVGRETPVTSGYIDLVGLARTGDLLVIEFKTGPQNPDFRHALAQLIDYGSDLWGMSFDEFESDVGARFFSSDRCVDSRLKGKQTLTEAADGIWDGLSEEEAEEFRRRLSQNLASGSFYYVLAAQSFTDHMQQTIEYLNAAMKGARFYGVEVVRFQGADRSAFEARTVIKPLVKSSPRAPQPITNEPTFLDSIGDESYREAVRGLFDLFRARGLRFEWGSIGTSVRLMVPGSTTPVTVAWFFPPGKQGWMSFTDVTLGYDPSSLAITDSVRGILENYVDAARGIPGATVERRGRTESCHLGASVVVDQYDRLVEVFKDLVNRINSST